MNPNRLNLRFRLWLAVIFLLAGLALLLFSILPTTRVQQVQQLPPVMLPTPTPVSLVLDLDRI